MYTIPVILGTVRAGRQSEKAAHYITSRLRDNTRVQTELLDLREWDFPFLHRRYRFQEHPSPMLKDFSDRLEAADSLIIVSPEYNNGYPGVLKNALDYFLPEFRRKPVGLVTVSSSMLGGVSCMQQLRQVCYGLGAFAVPVGLTIPRIGDVFDTDGALIDETFETRGERFLDELLWYTEAVSDRIKKRD